MPQLSTVSSLDEAMRVYFAAKAQMFAAVPSFGLLEVGPLKCFHNHPGWPEVDGFYAVDSEAAPDKVVSTIHAYQPAPEHMVTVFTDSPESVLSAYKARGYQPQPDPQPFMVKSLTTLPIIKTAANYDTQVFRVETDEQMVFINSGEKIMESAHLNDPLYRYYFMRSDSKLVCWGRCIVVSSDAIYVAGMETAMGYRRRGLATALMHQMHSDAAEAGASRSVLCSTIMGFGFYKKLDYTLLSYMQAFVPQEAQGAK